MIKIILALAIYIAIGLLWDRHVDRKKRRNAKQCDEVSLRRQLFHKGFIAK